MRPSHDMEQALRNQSTSLRRASKEALVFNPRDMIAKEPKFEIAYLTYLLSDATLHTSGVVGDNPTCFANHFQRMITLTKPGAISL